MTPHDSKTTLDRLWDDVPVGNPPIDDLVRGGKTMRRRARLRAAGAAAALTLVVVAGTTVAANTVFDGGPPRPDREVPAADVTAPTAPAGQRLVGMGRVVVAVPAEWGTNELDGCGSPAEPTGWFPIETPLDCVTFPYRVASVQFTTLDTDEGRQAAKHATTSTEVDGVEVRRGIFECPPIAECLFSPNAAPEYVVVPSEDVVITLFGPERVQDTLDAIADSVQILPEGYTTVPFVEGNNLAAWKAAIAEAGLVPDGAPPECEDVLTPQPGVSTSALCEARPRMRLEPGPGSVVVVGSTVTLFPSQPPGTPVEPPSARVKVEMNHCFVLPVAFDGRQWNVPFDKQFGSGGLWPKNWRGVGVMTRVSADRARFADDGGAEVMFRPVDDPRVRPVENVPCF